MVRCFALFTACSGRPYSSDFLYFTSQNTIVSDGGMLKSLLSPAGSTVMISISPDFTLKFREIMRHPCFSRNAAASFSPCVPTFLLFCTSFARAFPPVLPSICALSVLSIVNIHLLLQFIHTINKNQHFSNYFIKFRRDRITDIQG